MPAQNVLLLWTLEYGANLNPTHHQIVYTWLDTIMKNYYQNFTVIRHFLQVDAGQSFPQNANPSCWLMKYLFCFDTFKISLTNHTAAPQMLSISKRIWVVFVALSGVRNRWVSVFHPSWFGLVYARNECTVLTNQSLDNAHIFSGSLYRLAPTSKTEQTKSTRLSTRMTTIY